jgi:hypothetical protein
MPLDSSYSAGGKKITASPGQNVRPYLKNKQKKQKDWGMAEVIEC